MISLNVDLSPALAQLQGMGERAADAVREAAFKGTKLVFDEAYRRAPRSRESHWFYSIASGGDMPHLFTKGQFAGERGSKYLFQPGDLRKSLYIKHIEEEQIRGVREVYQVSFRRVYSEIGYVPYAHMIEYGTVLRPASPFVRPAFDAKKDEARALMLETVMRAVRHG